MCAVMCIPDSFTFCSVSHFDGTIVSVKTSTETFMAKWENTEDDLWVMISVQASTVKHKSEKRSHSVHVYCD